MATAPESEGKIMASAEDLCGLCEDHMAVKHCDVCPVDLCMSCAKGHQKLPTTRDHQLTDILRGNADSEPTKTSTTQGTCSKLGDQKFTVICKDCVILGCDSCKTDHSGHSILTLDSDPKLCHRVVSKNIQRLLDDVHELEEIKTVLEGQICAYDDARGRVDQWEIDLLKLVRDKAARIRTQLKDIKEKKYKQLSDQVNGLITKLKEVDQTFAKLTAVRKSIDFTVLTNELAKSQSLIQKLESYKEDLQPLPQPINVEDVLPNGDQLKIVDDGLDVMFTLGELHYPEKGPLPVAEWCFSAAKDGKDISAHGKNNVTMTDVKYGPGPNGEPQGAVIVPKSGIGSIIVMNPDQKLRFSGEMTFFMEVFHEGVTGFGSSGYLFIYHTGVTSIDGTCGIRMYIRNDYSLQIRGGVDFQTPAILKSNTWNKIVIVFRPTRVSVYINGTFAHTENIQLDLVHTQYGHLHFGRRPGCSGFLGRIASCKFFDVALNENEIQNL